MVVKDLIGFLIKEEINKWRFPMLISQSHPSQVSKVAVFFTQEKRMDFALDAPAEFEFTL